MVRIYVKYGQRRYNLFASRNDPFSATQPDAGSLASLSPPIAKSKGKTHHFAIYLLCGLFDTLENRVITSGLTLASIRKHFAYPTRYAGVLNLANVEAAQSPGKPVWNLVLVLKENAG